MTEYEKSIGSLSIKYTTDRIVKQPALGTTPLLRRSGSRT